MWPSELRHDHPSVHRDVEQNETTPWLRHTGWSRLFHNRSLAIIAAAARKPKPAWNEDYLLGQWHDEPLRSPAAVEAQLRVILRGIDLMIDRATFTLLKTSYRSRCWMNTYWKDNFWPHEFRIVGCLRNYVDIWKRFICYMFRVSNFDTHQQREIFNLRLRRDETIMMRHILYLVSLLQRETAPPDLNSDGASDEEEDEPSDYDDGDRDEDNDGDEEDYLTDYEGLEVGNRSNESNEDHDGNRGEDAKDTDPAFSLPPGLWLHLSEAIFQLSMIFWTYQEPTGDMSASAIIHFTAALGIHGSSFAFHSAHASSSRLAALMWIGRLLFLEYAVPVYAYNTLDLAWPCRTAYPSQPDRISFIRCKYLLRGCYTPFGELIELKAFAKSIVKREGVPGNLAWAPDGRSFTIGDDKTVRLSEFCEIHHKAVKAVQEQVGEMLLGWEPDIDVSAIRDDLTCRKAGWSFIDKIENNLVDIWKRLLHRLQKSSFRGTPFTKSGHWNAETCHKYLSAGTELNKSAFAAIHFRAGLPGRGTEVTSIRYLNSKLSIRNVFFYDGQMIIIISYNKARASNNYAFYIVRYVPTDLSLSLLKYLAIVRPVWEFIAREMQTVRHDSKEFFFLDPSGKRKHLSSEQASSILRSRTQDLVTPWTLSLYRQASLAIAKRYLTELVDKANFYYPSSAADPIRMFAAGAGHHPRMLLTTYAIDRALPERLQPELLEMYRRLSNTWQEWSRNYYEECCLQLQEGSIKPNTSVAHELCHKRPAEPDGRDRASKKLRTKSDSSCYDKNEANYSDGFLYNSEYQILICIACESMVQPGQGAFYRHLNNTHRITGLACKALIKRFNTYELCPFKKLVIPREKISPIPGLAVHTAFKCNVCVKVFGTPHFTSSSNKIRDHLIIHKLGISPMSAEELGMFQTCRVQTFSSARDKIRYFEIE
ncbi:hypothetical protein FOTG_18113 [Fusarium oxysporum f. sp. vasinfectum 25433]|uniref:Uncharacterized protein n=1 Tax=Fusarium oxysporum f. sp. vasinfectum 25433 TaxID=1089449 RepID=X0KXC4_FUSOX|nr:hypothetical protein FOTG_18113 [Fusarium oxysporum f. sp. vasinfectum 25433]